MQKYRALLVREQLGKEFGKLIDSECLSPETAAKLIFQLNNNAVLPEEHFWIIHLNGNKQLTGITEVSSGARDQTVVEPSAVFRTAILANTASIILVHNHPSGNVKPSMPDIATTKRLIDAGSLLGISVLDHVIIGDGNMYSLMEHGICEF